MTRPPFRFKARLAAAATLVLAVLCLPNGAVAGCSGQITKPAFPQIKVAGNGSAYTEVEGIASGWRARINIECGTLGRVKSWEMAPLIEVAGLGTLAFNHFSASKSYRAFSRPKAVHRTESVVFPHDFVQNFAVSACNMHADLLREDGLTDPVIFAQDRIVALHYWVRAEVETTFDGDSIFLPADFDSTSWGNVWTGKHHTEIICRKWTNPPEPGSDDLTGDPEFELLGAVFHIHPTSWEGTCPHDLELSLLVEANLNGPVTVRIESTDGWTSEPGVLATSEFRAESNRWRGSETEYLPVPVMLPTRPPSDGGLLPSPVDDFAPAGPDGPSGPDWTPGLGSNGPDSNVHQASLRMIATAGGETITTDWREYSFTCVPTPAVDGPGVIVSPDAPPPPEPKAPGPTYQ